MRDGWDEHDFKEPLVIVAFCCRVGKRLLSSLEIWLLRDMMLEFDADFLSFIGSGLIRWR
ncbi:hypothetical protein A8B75_06135 [Sphingomonadales bacterium EhC05]|nr:hypothetical protein A8B75_06135 [Sphingomonadales bacterium EhC05]